MATAAGTRKHSQNLSLNVMGSNQTPFKRIKPSGESWHKDQTQVLC